MKKTVSLQIPLFYWGLGGFLRPSARYSAICFKSRAVINCAAFRAPSVGVLR